MASAASASPCPPENLDVLQRGVRLMSALAMQECTELKRRRIKALMLRLQAVHSICQVTPHSFPPPIGPQVAVAAIHGPCVCVLMFGCAWQLIKSSDETAEGIAAVYASLDCLARICFDLAPGTLTPVDITLDSCGLSNPVGLHADLVARVRGQSWTPCYRCAVTAAC